MAEKRTRPRKSASTPGSRSRPAKRPDRNEAPIAPSPPTPVSAPTPAPAPVAEPASGAPARWIFGGPLVLVLAVLVSGVAVAGWLWMRGVEKEAFKLDLGVPTAASEGDLRAFSSPGRPVYWVGPANSGTLEVTRTSAGVFVRYLPTGVAVGDRAPGYTTIATYSTPDAYATTERSARTPGFSRSEAANGGLAVWRVARATSVYLAYPNSDYLVEIYDPSPRRARTLALSTRVRRVP